MSTKVLVALHSLKAIETESTAKKEFGLSLISATSFNQKKNQRIPGPNLTYQQSMQGRLSDLSTMAALGWNR